LYFYFINKIFLFTFRFGSGKKAIFFPFYFYLFLFLYTSNSFSTSVLGTVEELFGWKFSFSLAVVVMFGFFTSVFCFAFCADLDCLH